MAIQMKKDITGCTNIFVLQRGMTPLLHALVNCHSDVVDYLLSLDVNPSQTDLVIILLVVN